MGLSAPVSSPWLVPRTTPKVPTMGVPRQGVDPIIGVPTEAIPVSDLELASKQGTTLSTPNVIPVEKLNDPNNQRNKKDCKCPASHLCEGKPSMKPRGLNGLEYQLYIANLHSFPLVFSNTGVSPSGKSHQVTEWSFNSVDDFDGMWFKSCTLVEAKDRYEHMFRYSWFNPTDELERFENQILKHLIAVEASWKKASAKTQKVKLQWHFSEQSTLNRTKERKLVKAYIARGVELIHTPYMTKAEREKLTKKRVERMNNLSNYDQNGFI